MSNPYDFRKEEDVKEYLRNIGIEYRFGCYSEQNPEVCHLLAMYLEVIQQNVEQAKKVLKVNCDRHNWRFSCYKYAYLLEKENKPEHFENALNYYEKGCEAGYNKSCYMSGVRSGSKAEKEQNFDKKFKLYNKALQYMHTACEDKLGQACFNLASIYFTGIPEAKIPADIPKAFEYSVKACENHHLHSCANVSLMYLKGDGVEKNTQKAKEYQLKVKELERSMSEEGLKFGEGLPNV